MPNRRSTCEGPLVRTRRRALGALGAFHASARELVRSWLSSFQSLMTGILGTERLSRTGGQPWILDRVGGIYGGTAPSVLVLEPIVPGRGICVAPVSYNLGHEMD